MLDLALRVGFEIRLYQPYRAQTKGKVESGVKYVKGNMLPSMHFTDDADLNRQSLEWCDSVANRRIHGTTHRVPWEVLMEERPHLGKLPGRYALTPLPSGRSARWPGDGFVSWEGSRYGVHWKWVGPIVQGGQRQGTVEIWTGDERIAVHPRGQHPGQRFTLPANGRVFPREITGPGGRQWRCRYQSARWSGAPWMCMSWPPWEVHGDRPGAGQRVPGESGIQAGRGGLG